VLLVAHLHEGGFESGEPFMKCGGRGGDVGVKLRVLEEPPKRRQPDAGPDAEHEEPCVDNVAHEAETRRRPDEGIALVRDALVSAHDIEVSEGGARQAGLRRGVTLARALVSGLAVRLKSDDHLR
jgi:hypothetical protein